MPPTTTNLRNSQSNHSQKCQKSDQSAKQRQTKLFDEHHSSQKEQDASVTNKKQPNQSTAESTTESPKNSTNSQQHRSKRSLCKGSCAHDSSFSSPTQESKTATATSSQEGACQNQTDENSPASKSEGVALLDLRLFKTEACTKETRHNQKKCFFYHDKDKRRPLGTYSSEMCRFSETGKCPDGDACVKAHNRVESFYHPEKYKAKFCTRWPNAVDNCDFGNLCAFAHCEDELSIDLLHKMKKDADFYMFHFKTVWCPFNDKLRSHMRDECEYAHNWQDYRRKPHLYEYSHKEQCRFWSTKEETKTYSDGCDLEYRCVNCHGWKEKEYHPNNFRVSECDSDVSCRKKHCPYFHSQEEKRRPPMDVRLYPRNRGTSMGISHQYIEEYIRVMLTQPQRTNQIHPHRKSSHQSFPAQQIYGCGPQSTPIIDPQIVLCFQKIILGQTNGDIFKLAIGSNKQPEVQSATTMPNQGYPTQQNQFGQVYPPSQMQTHQDGNQHWPYQAQQQQQQQFMHQQPMNYPQPPQQSQFQGFVPQMVSHNQHAPSNSYPREMEYAQSMMARGSNQHQRYQRPPQECFPSHKSPYNQSYQPSPPFQPQQHHVQSVGQSQSYQQFPRTFSGILDNGTLHQELETQVPYQQQPHQKGFNRAIENQFDRFSLDHNSSAQFAAQQAMSSQQSNASYAQQQQQYATSTNNQFQNQPRPYSTQGQISMQHETPMHNSRVLYQPQTMAHRGSEDLSRHHQAMSFQANPALLKGAQTGSKDKSQFYQKQYTSMPQLLQQPHPKPLRADSGSDNDQVSANGSKVWGNSVLSANFETPIDNEDEEDIRQIALQNELKSFLKDHGLERVIAVVDRLKDLMLTLDELKTSSEDQIRQLFARNAPNIPTEDINQLIQALHQDSQQ